MKVKNDFNYYMHDGAEAFSFEIAGVISDGAAHELEQAWKTASSTADIQRLIVDLSYVTQVDSAGRRMLREWHDAGAQLIAKRPQAKSMIGSITGQQIEVVAEAAPRHTWRPLHAFLTIALAVLLGPAPGIAMQFLR